MEASGKSEALLLLLCLIQRRPYSYAVETADEVGGKSKKPTFSMGALLVLKLVYPMTESLGTFRQRPCKS